MVRKPKIKMAELFIELFSEEIPAKLQIDIRQKIKQTLEEKLKKKEINFSLSESFSTPKRLVFFINGIPEKIEQKGSIIKGPKIGAPAQAIEGFIKSNNELMKVIKSINQEDIESSSKGSFEIILKSNNKIIK